MMTGSSTVAAQPVRLGLRENAPQFTLLVVVNAFVGAVIGLERTILPLIAEADFQLAARTAILSFIAVFGIAKALMNYAAGSLANRVGRKKLLVYGWVLAVPVPLMLIVAPSWSWILVANVLLGASQGLTWSTTVIMKIDLVGPRRRGLAMGLNEFAGYGAMAASAYLTGHVAASYGLRPEPFYAGIAYVALGLALSVLFVRDTREHVELEAASAAVPDTELRPSGMAAMTWRDSSLSSITQGGFVNNLNDGLAWGIFPLWFAANRLPIEQIAILAALYPAVWGVAQIGTGPLSDVFGRKWLMVGGMVMQGFAILTVALSSSFAPFLIAAIFLGLGTAAVYPTFLAAIGDHVSARERSGAVGIYRFWRDFGYVAGALLAGAIADLVGLRSAIVFGAAITTASGVVIAVRYAEAAAEERAPLAVS